MNSSAKLFSSKSSMMLPSVLSPSLSSQRSSSSLTVRLDVIPQTALDCRACRSAQSSA
jgi:hypothetical protein